MQASSLAAGLGTNWITLPGSAMLTATNLPISETNAGYFIV